MTSCFDTIFLWSVAPWLIIPWLMSPCHVLCINQYELPGCCTSVKTPKSKKFHNEKMNEYVKCFKINQIKFISLDFSIMTLVTAKSCMAYGIYVFQDLSSIGIEWEFLISWFDCRCFKPRWPRPDGPRPTCMKCWELNC